MVTDEDIVTVLLWRYFIDQLLYRYWCRYVHIRIHPCSEYIALPRAEMKTNQIFKLTLLDNERFMSVIQKNVRWHVSFPY